MPQFSRHRIVCFIDSLIGEGAEVIVSPNAPVATFDDQSK
jgi:hypothetical protein